MRRTENPLPPDTLSRVPELGTALAADPRIVFAYLFGGLARGRLTPLSDADIAVFLEPKADFTEARLDLIGVVSDVLGSDAVDLIVLNDAPISLSGRVLQAARVLVDRDPEQCYAYEPLTRRIFWDFQMMENRILDARYGTHG